MNFKTWTVGIAVLTLATAPAFAETGLGQWSYDQNVVPVGLVWLGLRYFQIA